MKRNQAAVAAGVSCSWIEKGECEGFRPRRQPPAVLAHLAAALELHDRVVLLEQRDRVPPVLGAPDDEPVDRGPDLEGLGEGVALAPAPPSRSTWPRCPARASATARA